MKQFCIAIFFSSLVLSLKAQNLPVGDAGEERYRNDQLMGKGNAAMSFMIRPLSLPEYDAPLRDSSGSPNKKFKLLYSFLPATWNQQYVSKQPYGWNDGALIPASGYQTLLSGGIYAKFGPLSIQLRPEVVWAENKDFSGFPSSYSDKTWSDYYGLYYNLGDVPERFGTKSYHKLTPGQSNIKLTFGPVSLGFSSENMWWGPGIYNSITMSNTAQGFRHLTLNTVKPVVTPVGSFEGQVISGRLEQSGYLPPESDRLLNGNLIYSAKPPDWRYLSGIALSYHPKWVSGFFMGITRAFYVNHNDMKHTFVDYFPFLTPFEKSKTGAPGIDDAREKDQLTSLSARWVWKEANAEMYLEYGRNDHSYNGRDFLLEPEHSNAYTAGLSKIIPVPAAKGYFKAKIEITRLVNAYTYLLRAEPLWYLHYQVRDGYTNNGEVVGAGIGPGSNYHVINVSWFKKELFAGLQFDWLERNQDIYRFIFYQENVNRKWVDYSYSLDGNRRYRNFLFQGKLRFVHSSNYEWNPGVKRFNAIASAGINYYFKK